MIPLSTLTARLSDGLALPKQRVELVARRMREAAALPTGTSGPHDSWKAHISPEDAVKLLLAVMSDCPATEAADTADRLAALPVSEVLAIHADGSTEIVLPGSACYQGLTQSGDTLGAILTAHLETLILDVACPGEIEVLSVNDQWPTAYISAVCNGLRIFVLCSLPRKISNASLAAMTKEARCGGVIFPYLARLYREGLQADYRAGQESEARA